MYLFNFIRNLFIAVPMLWSSAATSCKHIDINVFTCDCRAFTEEVAKEIPKLVKKIARKYTIKQRSYMIENHFKAKYE